MVWDAIIFDKFIWSMCWSCYDCKTFPVLSFIGKSILHVFVKFKPKSSQISCLVIFSDIYLTYIFFIVIFCSDLWWSVWMGCDISCSCEKRGSEIGGYYPSCEANFFSEAVAGRFSVKKVFLEISHNSQEKTCARDSFLIKLKA